MILIFKSYSKLLLLCAVAFLGAEVHGVPDGASGTIVGAIGRHPVDRKKQAVLKDLEFQMYF